MSKNQEATETLERFSAQIGWVTDSVVRNFGLEDHFRDEVHQEAEILVTAYSGLMDQPSWGNGRLCRFEAQARGDESQVKALLATQLRIDLSQIVMRMINRNGNKVQHDSLDQLVEDHEEPTDELWEARQMDQLNGSDHSFIHRHYPTLASNLLEGFTQAEIAANQGVDVRTIRRHIQREKRDFLASYLRRHGLRVEGDETMADLEEAYRYLTVAGR